MSDIEMQPNLPDRNEPGHDAASLSARALRVWLQFAEEPRSTTGEAPDAEAAEVDTVLEEFGGDFRAAIRALLHDVAVLAADFAAAVSRGYVRGSLGTAGTRRRTASGE